MDSKTVFGHGFWAGVNMASAFFCAVDAVHELHERHLWQAYFNLLIGIACIAVWYLNSRAFRKLAAEYEPSAEIEEV